MRKIFNKMEKKIGRFAIKGLMKYIIVLYIIGFVIIQFRPEFYLDYLCLDVTAIMRGQIWRVITFIIQPPTTSIIFVIFSLYLYYILGTILEKFWGAFKFNVYYFSGVIFTVLAAFIVYWVTGVSYIGMSTYYINMSLFLAFATVQPDMVILFMFIIPIKMKWFALLDVAYLVYHFIQGYTATRISIVVALINFIIYFFIFMKDMSKNGNGFGREERKRRDEFYRNYNSGQSSRETGDGSRNPEYNNSGYQNSQEAGGQPHINMRYGNRNYRHRCFICGRTELDNEDLEFRYCSRCKGSHEYCSDHLFTHEHVK